MNEMECRTGLDRQIEGHLFINVLRGIAIFLMLWGHCIQYCCQGSFDFFENGVFKAIYSFHMPLFMLISGYLFFFSTKKRTLKEILINKTQSMLQPIFMCAILGFLLWDVVIGLLKGDYTVVFGGRWIAHLTDYWFLWSVLSSSVVVGIACKITKKKWLSVIILVLGIPFVCMMPCAEMNIYMYPYFVIGFIFSAVNHTDCIKKLRPIKYTSLVLFPVMLFFYRKEHFIYTSGLLEGG